MTGTFEEQDAPLQEMTDRNLFRQLVIEEQRWRALMEEVLAKDAGAVIGQSRVQPVLLAPRVVDQPKARADFHLLHGAQSRTSGDGREQRETGRPG
jgi:hypothetical protein